MSYSIGSGSAPVSRSDLTAALEASAEQALASIDDQFKEAAGEHIGQAIGAAVDLAKVVGNEDSLLVVNISGHANPDHAPLEGWADESVSINVSVVPAPA